MNEQPWASGISEILKHGLSLLKKDTDTNRRLAMISIDNAVELMIKTYLGLPERVIGFKISRKELSEITVGFPKLLDGLEKYAIAKLSGVNLGEIEWYHRLRNELYHNGNGLTVEREKVVIYSELAKLLFKNLFAYEIIPELTTEETLRRFFRTMAMLMDLAPKHMLQIYVHNNIIGRNIKERIFKLYEIREEIILGTLDDGMLLTHESISEAESLISFLNEQKPSLKDKLEEYESLSEQYINLKVQRVGLESSLPALKEQIDRNKFRIDELLNEDESSCPLCDQLVSKEYQKLILSELKAEGVAMEERFQSNKNEIQAMSKSIANLEKLIQAQKT